MKDHPITRLCIVLILSICATTAPARTWTDSTGTHKVEGEFVKLAESTVDIRRSDGQLLHIPLEKLSAADQAFVRHVAKPIAKETPSVAAAPDESPAATAKPAAASGDAKDTQTVFAEGVGTTKEEALKDAFRAAVRHVVGEAVDAETIVKNEELVKDQVLTYSDGFIPEHKVTSEKHDNGLFRMGILAKVQRRSVIMKLQAAKITLKNFDGQSLYGSIVTQITAENDAAALVAKALEGFPDNYMEAHAVGEPKVLERTDSEATLLINVEFAPSLVAYKAFAARFCKTLAGSCKSKGEFTSVILNKYERYGDRSVGRGKGSVKPKKMVGSTGEEVREIFNFEFDSEVAKWMPKLLKRGPGHYYQWTSEGFVFAVANLVSEDSSRVNWNYYLLDAAVRDAVVRVQSREATCKLSLLDADGQPVAVESFDPRNIPMPDDQRAYGTRWRNFLCIVWGWEDRTNRRMGDGEEEGLFAGRSSDQQLPHGLTLVAPLLFRDPNGLAYVPKLTIPRKVKLSLDELRKVAKVKCELTFRAEDGDEDSGKSPRGKAGVRKGKKK